MTSILPVLDPNCIGIATLVSLLAACSFTESCTQLLGIALRWWGS